MTVMSKEELNRVKAGKTGRVTLDLHGLHYKEAIRLVKNYADIFQPDVMTIVHGYNHGTVLRDALRKQKIVTRPYKMFKDKNNDGVTVFKFQKRKLYA